MGIGLGVVGVRQVALLGLAGDQTICFSSHQHDGLSGRDAQRTSLDPKPSGLPGLRGLRLVLRTETGDERSSNSSGGTVPLLSQKGHQSARHSGSV